LLSGLFPFKIIFCEEVKKPLRHFVLTNQGRLQEQSELVRIMSFEKHSKTLLIYRVLSCQNKNNTLYKFNTTIYFNTCIPSNAYKINQMHYFGISEPTFIPGVVVLGVVPDWSKQNDVTVFLLLHKRLF
jgi:hypothetical protein